MNSSGRSPFSKNLTGCSSGCGSATSGAAAVTRCVARRVAQHLDDRLLGLLDGPARHAGVRLRSPLAGSWLGNGRVPNSTGTRRPSRPITWRSGEPLLAPPRNVGRVAEGADHEDAGALLAVDELAREDRHRHAEDRRHGALAEERAVARVVRVRGDADAGRAAARGASWRSRSSIRRRRRSATWWKAPCDGRSSTSAWATAVWKSTSHMVGASTLYTWPLRCRSRKLSLREAPAALVDRRVLEPPVDGEAEPLPEGLERLLVLGGQRQAELDEVPARDSAGRLLASRVVGHREDEPGLVAAGGPRSARGR